MKWMIFTKDQLFFLLFLSSSILGMAQGEWKKRPDFIGGNRENTFSFSIGTNGYVGTGSDALEFKKDFWQYDAVANKWWQKPSLPGEARIAAFAFSMNGKGYIGTGQSGTQDMRKSLNDVWEFDPETNRWEKKLDFPGGMRYSSVSFTINGKGYVGLGSDGSKFYNDLWEYNATDDKWIKKADFPGTPRMEAACFVVDGQAYVMLGQKNKLFGKEKDCYCFDPIKNKWKKVADFPGNVRIGEMAFGIENKGYVFGGFNGITTHYSDFWEYDVATDKWTQLKDPSFGARDYSFCFVVNTSAYIGAGRIVKNLALVDHLWEYYVKPTKPLKNTKNNFAFGGSLLLGEDRAPMGNVEVKLVNTKDGTEIKVNANVYGSFLFSSIPPSENYMLSIEVTDPKMRGQKVFLVNRSNQPIAGLDSVNDFKYMINQSEIGKFQLMKVENKNLRMDLSGKLAVDDGKRTPLKNIDVALINRNEKVVQMTSTDANGKYAFTYLAVDTGLYISLNQKDLTSIPKESTILMIDEKENVVAKSKVTSPIFHFTYLPAEEHSLAKIYIEDTWVQVTNMGATGKKMLDTLKLIENIYFDYGKAEIGSEAKATLNKAIIAMKNNLNLSIEINAHTDSRGDALYNLTLSDKRANAAKEYLVSQGINAKRLTAKGFGENKLLNKCKDGVDCTEEEHAQNRRMEFKFKVK